MITYVLANSAFDCRLIIVSLYTVSTIFYSVAAKYLPAI